MQTFERTTTCGLVTEKFLGKTIHLCGWVNKRRDHGGLIFIDLRDRTGLMQVVFNPAFDVNTHKEAGALRSEFVISVSGVVVERTAETVNPDLATGRFELQVTKLTILNKAKPLPFSLDEAHNVDEELRLKYRYLDLRRPEMTAKFALRSKVTAAMRAFFDAEGFYDLETPILTKNTPEGAREYLVPSRIYPGSFYALPQSPQMYKQLLMASGMDKYYQIARCFRDEDLRADRQPEFTQLDIEMSFIQEKDIQDLIERLLASMWKRVFNKDLQIPFPRMTYEQAFNEYGSDKPDLRFDLKIHDATSLFGGTDLKFLRAVLDGGGKVGGLHVENHAFTRSEVDGWADKAQALGAKGMLWIRFREDGTPDSPVAKFLPEDFLDQAASVFPGLTKNSTLFLIAGPVLEAWTLLGRLRLQLANELKMIPHEQFHFSWVIDFPLFEYSPEKKSWDAVHHPFTSPQDGWEKLQPGQMKARAYDVILNGVELGGGSIRIHDNALQRKVFDLLGLTEEQVQQKFGFLLEAQHYGFPPHGGIALGLDRFIMLISGSQSIREVIAFPKTARGVDPMMEAPTPVEPEKLVDYGLRLRPVVKE